LADIFDPSQIIELEYISGYNIDHILSMFKNLRSLTLYHDVRHRHKKLKEFIMPEMNYLTSLTLHFFSGHSLEEYKE
jgi:hypothetical protein